MFTPRSTRWMTVALLAAAALVPCRLAYAQRAGADTLPRPRAPTHVTVTPFAGMYNAVGKLRADSTVEFLQLMTLVVGARVARPFGSRFALEATGGWTPVPNYVTQSDYQETVDVPGRVAIVSLRGRYNLNPHPADGDLAFSLASGVGLVHRYGKAWEGTTGTTDGALALGLTSRMHSSNKHLSYGLDVDGFFTRASFIEYTGAITPTRLHLDLVTSLALTWTF
jgi:hypothetical protein